MIQQPGFRKAAHCACAAITPRHFTASELRERLGLESAPLTLLVAQATEILKLELPDGNLIERCRACFDHLVLNGADPTPPPADVPPRSAGGGAASSSTGGGTSLLDGTYNEEESSASFAEAVAAFRGEPPPSREKKNKGPPLGERLIAKGLVSGCNQ